MGTPFLSRPKEPSLYSSAGALLLLDSWCSPNNPAPPSLLSPTSDVGRAENSSCPGSAAKFRGDNESAQTHPCDQFRNRKDIEKTKQGFCCNICGPCHKKLPNTTSLPNFFHLVRFLERNRRRG